MRGVRTCHETLPGALTQPRLGERAQALGARRRHASAGRPGRCPAAGRGSPSARRRPARGRTGRWVPPARSGRGRTLVGDHDVAQRERLEDLVVGELGAVGSTGSGGAGRWSAARRGRGGRLPVASACLAPRSASSVPGPVSAWSRPGVRVARAEDRDQHEHGPPRPATASATSAPSRGLQSARGARWAWLPTPAAPPVRGSRRRESAASASRSVMAS